MLTITPEKINRVKILLQTNSIRESGRQANISYYTAWCISKGKYDNNYPLQQSDIINICPITGFYL